MVILQADLDSRVKQIRGEYIDAAWPDYQQIHAQQAEIKFRSYVLDNLTRIRKRLGGERYQTLVKLFSSALDDLFAQCHLVYLVRAICLAAPACGTAGPSPGPWT